MPLMSKKRTLDGVLSSEDNFTTQRYPKRLRSILAASDDTQEQLSSYDEPDVPSPDKDSPKSFQDLGIVESLCEACAIIGYRTPTAIQAQCIPLALQGHDLIGLAETGSGKTAVFLLPMLQALLSKPQSLHSLIIAPTRELAQQISRVVEVLGAAARVRCALLIGRVDMMAQSIALARNPHVLVATPGRLLDHLEVTRGFSLRELQYLVLDEADRLLDLAFGAVLDKILKILPRRTTYLFSATLSRKVESLQRAALLDPVRVTTTSKRQTVSTLLQSYAFIPHKHKDIRLVHLLNEHVGSPAIIFTRTVLETQRVTLLLRALGFPALPLHGQFSQSARSGALNKFRAGGSCNLLVATDVASRGLDIPSVEMVLNFDLPGDSATYIHRVGRTARAGRRGIAVSFVTQYDVEVWLRIEHALRMKLSESKVEDGEVVVFWTPTPKTITSVLMADS